MPFQKSNIIVLDIKFWPISCTWNWLKQSNNSKYNCISNIEYGVEILTVTLDDLEYLPKVIHDQINIKKNIKQEKRSVELRVCPMQPFHFWSGVVHPVQNLLLCTKFRKNRMIFRWDMAIYRFSKWRSSAILELFYHHTRPPTKSLLLAAAGCQISCQSDIQIWRYSYLNFSHIWLEMPIQAPKMGGFGGLWTPKYDL